MVTKFRNKKSQQPLL